MVPRASPHDPDMGSLRWYFAFQLRLPVYKVVFVFVGTLLRRTSSEYMHELAKRALCLLDWSNGRRFGFLGDVLIRSDLFTVVILRLFTLHRYYTECGIYENFILLWKSYLIMPFIKMKCHLIMRHLNPECHGRQICHVIRSKDLITAC